MIETDWLHCVDPEPMLMFLSEKASARKLRLFLCARAREITPLLTDDRSLRAIEVAERYADGLASPEELKAALKAACDAAAMVQERLPPSPIPLTDCQLDAFSAAWEVTNTCSHDIHAEDIAKRKGIVQPDVQCHLLREIFFFQLFRPVTFDILHFIPNNRTASTLARAVYEERAFDRLPILADALEDAGCNETLVLNHCRGPGPHVRGCWVVDLLLGYPSGESHS